MQSFLLSRSTKLLLVVILICACLSTNHAHASQAPPASYWMADIKRQGTVAYGNNTSNYTIFRNVKDFGAKGDGKTDDTAAITQAISSGNRCGFGNGCSSSTTTPAIVYFPAGTYVVSSPIISEFYTHLIGDALNLPTLKASAHFSGTALIDSDPTNATGVLWYGALNNFYRQTRNFIIDLTATQNATGIHWEVSQAASLQNIAIEMTKGGAQRGIYIDGGAGGFIADIVFNGGSVGASFGNQQFTMRNLTFNSCSTGISMPWGYSWSFRSLAFNACSVGLNISRSKNATEGETIGAVVVGDSTVSDTAQGIVTSFNLVSLPSAGGSLILDNVEFRGSGVAVASVSGEMILAGGRTIDFWAQGNGYVDAAGNLSQWSKGRESFLAPSKPKALLTDAGRVFEKSRPQYSNYPASSFISVKSKGAKGDGVTDDTAALQQIFDTASTDSIVYFDHGAYVISDTLKVPKNIRITGEIWPLIMVSGPKFQNQFAPVPAFQVGQPGDVGTVEISDLIFEIIGPQPGAVIIEWNIAGAQPGAAGIWDVHARLGGSAGTHLQSDRCASQFNTDGTADPNCTAAFLMLHVTKTGSAYLENNWFWLADHELDLAQGGELDLYNGRGVLIESEVGPVWMYGTAAEHSTLYQYQLVNARNVFLSIFQSETPYFQPHPPATEPFTPQASWNDPTFSHCTDPSCRMAWAFRSVNSSDIFVYGAAAWCWFNDWDFSCSTNHSCQDTLISIEQSEDVYLAGFAAVGAQTILSVDGMPVVRAGDNIAVDGTTGADSPAYTVAAVALVEVLPSSL